MARRTREVTKTVEEVLVPGSVWVLGKMVKIEPVDPDAAPSFGTDRIGEFRPHANIIRYDPGTEIQQIQETIVHEIVHAIDWNLSLGFTERTVQRLGVALRQILVENPNFGRVPSGEVGVGGRGREGRPAA